MMKITRKTHNIPTTYRPSVGLLQGYAMRNDKCRPPQRSGVVLFIMLSVLVVVLGGLFALFWQVQINLHATNTQRLLTGMGLMTTLLLAVPGLLIHGKRRSIGRPLARISMSSLTFGPKQAANGLSVTSTLRLDAISAQRLKLLYMNQYSPVLEGQNTNAIHVGQLSFDSDVLATPSFRKPILQSIANGRTVGVPPKPIQRVPVIPLFQGVPVTPLFQGVPVTPLLSRNSQGGLLTRYNMQYRPRGRELTHLPGTKNPYTETYHQ